jgi:hypothetical protein
MRQWAERTFGKSPDDVTIADVEQTLPRREDLQDPPFTDSRGGRVRFNLHAWPSPEKAKALEEAAERFRAKRP